MEPSRLTFIDHRDSPDLLANRRSDYSFFDAEVSGDVGHVTALEQHRPRRRQGPRCRFPGERQRQNDEPPAGCEQ
jgi:hypothetical protein